jgi:hypothetical protein
VSEVISEVDYITIDAAFQLEARPVVIELATMGEQGLPGPPGPPGDAPYVHHQETPAATWVIEHNRQRVVTPTIVLDSQMGAVVWTDVEVLDLNTLTLTFPSPESGYAYV